MEEVFLFVLFFGRLKMATASFFGFVKGLGGHVVVGKGLLRGLLRVMRGLWCGVIYVCVRENGLGWNVG